LGVSLSTLVIIETNPSLRHGMKYFDHMDMYRFSKTQHLDEIGNVEMYTLTQHLGYEINPNTTSIGPI
jgi:tRNA A37 threonylcarbamoyladenosine biosynthesis protein TsaE